MTRSLGMLATVLTLGASAACAAQTGAEAPADVPSDDLTFAGADEPVRVPAVGQVLVAVTQPAVLAALETRGFSINAVMARGLNAAPATKINTAALYDETPWYRSFADDIARDVQQRGTALGGVHGAPQTDQPRVFDYGYLRSQEGTYDLVSVVSRLDRRDFAPGASCGELRFIYRLKYKKGGASGAVSRLPFSLNVVYAAPDDGARCASFAKRWQVPSGIDTGAKYVDWIATQSASTSGFAFKQLEANVQANRFPSEAQPELGGSAEYLLRVYGPEGATLHALPLENTPDVAKLRADATLRDELVEYIKTHVAEIDQGTFTVPQKFLATKVTSVSTHGLFRMNNRPFSQLFKEADLGLEASAFAGTKVIGSAAGVLARLDDATCSGCHQGASVAGFHIVGTENLSKVHPLNATRLATSAHFASDEPRRKAYATALIEGREPDKQRPVSFLESKNGPGMHCIAGPSTSAFKAAYGCQDGLACRDLERNVSMPLRIGTCMHGSAADTRAGEPCVGSDHTSSIDPANDTARMSSPLHPNCLDPVQGTPGGLVTRACGPTFSDAAHTARGGEVCAYNGGAGFDVCAASGDFSQCLGDASTFTRGLRGLCDETTACRDDYICQRFFDISGPRATVTSIDKDAGAPRSPGFCVPTYFLFQMRVDGHADSGKRWLD